MKARDVQALKVQAAGRLQESTDKTASSFYSSFLSRYPHIRKHAPTKIIDKTGKGESSHPEARQHGSEIWLFPKFYLLPADVQDFVLAHEVGHYWASELGLQFFIDKLAALGIDAWDTSSLPFGQSNVGEALADVFATYFLDHTDLVRRYPDWAKLFGELL